MLTHALNFCEDCERCRWNREHDCLRVDHPHCVLCGHCQYRHSNQKDNLARFRIMTSEEIASYGYKSLFVRASEQ